MAVVYLPTMIWQFLAKKGDQQHLQRGLALKWLAIPMIGVSAFWVAFSAEKQQREVEKMKNKNKTTHFQE